MRRLLPLLALAAALLGATLPPPARDAEFRSHPRAKVELGRLLFYDRVLSGDFRVSCASCHHHRQASSNGVPLADDAGREPDERAAAEALADYRRLNPSADHAPPLFNLGHRSVTALFHDRRVRREGDRIVSPLGDDLPAGIESVLAVQALVPAVTTGEQVGNGHGNALERLASRDRRAVFRELERRLAGLPDYAPLFRAAYPRVREPADIRIHHVANAIAAFVATEWRADDSPFDRYLRGKSSLTERQREGLDLFYGSAGCATCHAGPFGSDGRVYPAVRASAKFAAIRTPMLRNVVRTGPWGHGGRFETLPSFLAAHVPETSADERAALLAFLRSLTDERSLSGRLGPPAAVPSGLVLD